MCTTMSSAAATDVSRIKRKADGDVNGLENGSHQDGPSTRKPRLDIEAGEREFESHSKHFLTSFEALKAEQKLTDFVIEVGGEEIHVHRAALAAVSKYFEAMFSHPTAESKSGRVKLYQMDANAVKQCIEFIYTGKTKFTCESPEKLVFSAELMQLTALTDMYFQYLKENIDVENCLRLVELAETYNQRSFEEFFVKFTEDNFADIVEKYDFKNMSKALLEQCLRSVSSPLNFTDLESLKLGAVLQWTEADMGSRKKEFPNLLKFIRFQYLVTDEHFQEGILSDHIVSESHECKDKIIEAFFSLNIPATARSSRSIQSDATHIIAYHSMSRMLHSMNVETKKWSRVGRITVDMSNKKPEIASVGGEIYVTTGDAFYKFFDGVPVNVAPTKTGRGTAYRQCIVRGDIIYVVETGCVGKFNTRSNDWSVIQTNLNLGEGFFLANSEKFIYAMGGDTTSTVAKEFDFLTETWEPIECMNNKRSYGAAVVFESMLYAIGGIVNFDSGLYPIEFYSPEMNLWTNMPTRPKSQCTRLPSELDLQCCHRNCKAFVIGKIVYVVGGLPRQCHSNQYVPRSNMIACDFKKTTVTALKSIRIDCGLACIVQAK